MKTLIFIFISITILGCNKEELPKETQEGEDTFGMLVKFIKMVIFLDIKIS